MRDILDDDRFYIAMYWTLMLMSGWLVGYIAGQL